MSNKLLETQKKLQAQLMENKSRQFQDSVIAAITTFRSSLMECFGADKNDSRRNEARDVFADATQTISHFSYTFRVGDEFVERVEKSISCGYTPEHQLQCTRYDNSNHCQIEGDMIDIIYEISMPIVVKKEKPEDDNCLLVMVQPAPQSSFQNVTVKTEKNPEKQMPEGNHDATKPEENKPESPEKMVADSSPSKSSAGESHKQDEEEEDEGEIDVVATPIKKKKRGKKEVKEDMEVEVPKRNFRPRT